MMQILKAVGLATAVVVALAATDASAGTTKKRSNKQVTGVLNLNSATAAQLDVLPGVGEKAAQRIIEHRRKTPFTRPEELVKVKGFGKKKYEKLKAHLTVAGPTTLAPKKDDGPEPAAQARSAPPKR